MIDNQTLDKQLEEIMEIILLSQKQNLRKGMKSRIKEAIVSQINKYIDIKVEPDNNSNFFFLRSNLCNNISK